MNAMAGPMQKRSTENIHPAGGRYEPENNLLLNCSNKFVTFSYGFGAFLVNSVLSEVG